MYVPAVRLFGPTQQLDILLVLAPTIIGSGDDDIL